MRKEYTHSYRKKRRKAIPAFFQINMKIGKKQEQKIAFNLGKIQQSCICNALWISHAFENGRSRGTMMYDLAKAICRRITFFLDLLGKGIYLDPDPGLEALFWHTKWPQANLNASLPYECG
jgi:hypothetical protein